jgi:hypothetical protein
MTSAQKLRWKIGKKKVTSKNVAAVSNRQARLPFDHSTIFSMDLPSAAQIITWKKMSLSEKYLLLASTIRQARNLKRIGIKLRHPDASPLEIEQKLSSIWLHARP